jgi:hypothetical protein
MRLMGRPVTYREIETWVETQYGFRPYDCWITHCKELANLPVRRRYEGSRPRERQCPIERQTAILNAFAHFGLTLNLAATESSHTSQIVGDRIIGSRSGHTTGSQSRGHEA